VCSRLPGARLAAPVPRHSWLPDAQFAAIRRRGTRSGPTRRYRPQQHGARGCPARGSRPSCAGGTRRATLLARSSSGGWGCGFVATARSPSCGASSRGYDVHALQGGGSALFARMSLGQRRLDLLDGGDSVFVLVFSCMCLSMINKVQE